MFKLTVQPYGSTEVLQEVVATPAVNQATLLVIVLLLAQGHPCVEVGVVGMEAFEVDLLAPTVQRPATSVVDQTIMLAIARLMQ